jgi:RNase P subunit RPR2
VAEHLRKEAEEEAARKYLKETDRIERPAKNVNLRVAMSLDSATYRRLCVSCFSSLLNIL